MEAGSAKIGEPSPRTRPLDSRPSADGHVLDNLDTLLSLYAKEEAGVDRHQRLVETVTNALGQPRSVYLILGLVTAWTVFNASAKRLHLFAFDPPPFAWLQGIINLAALVTTTVVLTTQKRQGRDAERRSFLDLQVNLLTEKKVAKLIALVEELRRDHPNIRNRSDPEAESMTRTADPEAIISAIEDTVTGPRMTPRAEDPKAGKRDP